MSTQCLITDTLDVAVCFTVFLFVLIKGETATTRSKSATPQEAMEEDEVSSGAEGQQIKLESEEPKALDKMEENMSEVKAEQQKSQEPEKKRKRRGFSDAPVQEFGPPMKKQVKG